MKVFPTDMTEKVAPSDNDFILISDSADSNKVKKGRYSNFKWEQWDPGPAGTDWLSVNWLWAYSWVTAYVINDAVSYLWSSYICILASTGNLPTNVTYWWVLATAGAGSWDMLKATYDPTNVNGNAFDMENMTEWATKKILTTAERTKLSNTSGTNSWDNATNSSSMPAQPTTIELGNASDTTLARVSAGVISVEWVTIPSVSSTNTFTNKRITERITTITSSATPTVNTDNCDAVTITALATVITSMTTNLTGTPTNFQKLVFRIKDNATARAITWGASFEARWVALPTTTVISKVLTVWFIYDTVTSKRWCVASVNEA